MRDAGLMVACYCVPCNCTCRHCLLESRHEAEEIPYHRIQSLVERFAEWKRQKATSDFLIGLTIGYCADFPEVTDYVRFLHRIGFAGARFLQLNGIAFRSRDEVLRWLSAVKKAGVATVGVSFYGYGNGHDAWAGRRGDFDFNLRLCRAASDLGLGRVETIFLTEDFIFQYRALLDTLDSIPGLELRDICLWDYRGRGKLLEPRRITAETLEALPERVLRHVNLNAIKTESKWLEVIQRNSAPRKTQRWLFLVVNSKNIEELESKSCDMIVNELQALDIRFYEALPSIAELAEMYGDRSNQRVYRLRDLEWKWTDRYFSDRPGLDLPIPSDLKSGSFRR